MKLIILFALLAFFGSAQQVDTITSRRITVAIDKVRSLYRPCYPTKAEPKPKPCPVEWHLLQDALPVMEEFAAQMRAAGDDQNKFNTEPARSFVERVESRK